MAKYLVKRVLMMFLTIILAVTTIFLMLRVLSGDPAVALLGEAATQATLENLRHQLGLDQPLIVQYLDYMGGLLRGDLGRSIITNDLLTPIILRNLFFTIILALMGLVIGLVIGIPAGVLSAIHRDSLLDHLGRIVVMMGISLPKFIIGILLLIIFSINLRWFPLMGGGEISDPASLLYFTFLPALTFGLAEAVVIMRITRSSMLEVLGKDYIRTARSKGLPDKVVIYKHALRNSLISITTVVGIMLGRTMAGSAVIETIFTRPGLGSLFIESVRTRDYILTQSTLVVFAVMIIVVNLIVDLFYAVIDPRIRLD